MQKLNELTLQLFDLAKIRGDFDIFENDQYPQLAFAQKKYNLLMSNKISKATDVFLHNEIYIKKTDYQKELEHLEVLNYCMMYLSLAGFLKIDLEKLYEVSTFSDLLKKVKEDNDKQFLGKESEIYFKDDLIVFYSLKVHHMKGDTETSVMMALYYLLYNQCPVEELLSFKIKEEMELKS